MVEQLLWKKVEYNFGQAQYLMAENWCKLALTHIFQSSGHNNGAKLQRHE